MPAPHGQRQQTVYGKFSVIPSDNPDFVSVSPLSLEAPLPGVPGYPAWKAWDVLKIALFMFIAPFFLDILLSFAAHKFLYPEFSWQQLAQKPVVELTAEVISYFGLIFYMIALVEGQYHRRFLEALSWNWPKRVWRLALFGVVLLFAIQGLSHFLPMPKDVPFEEFFRHPLEAYLTSILAISIGPFMEEIFFRGFLYPVLARHLGVGAGIFLTALGFGLLHAMQLAFGWGAVFIIFLVGLALTIVRAVTNSVASSLIVHIAYNFTLTALSFIATGGFRHLDRLNF